MFLANALSLSLVVVWLGWFPSASHGGSYMRNTTSKYVKPKRDFYTRKMMAYFSATDADKDGYISARDYDIMTNRFIHNVHMCRYDAKILLYKKLPKIYNSFHHDEKDEGKPASMEEMIAAVRKRKVHKHLGMSVTDFAGQEFDIIDLDSNGKVTLLEHKADFKSRGVDLNFQPKSFAAIDTNGDGVIERHEFTSGAESFFTSEDESCNSKYFYGPMK